MSTPAIRITSKPKTIPVNQKDTGGKKLPQGGFFKRRINLGIKLPLLVILMLSLAFVISTYLGIRATRTALAGTIENELQARAASQAEIIRTNLVWTRSVAISLSTAAETTSYDEQTLINLIHNTLESNTQIFGSTIAYEPYQFDPKLYYWSPYYSRAQNIGLQFTQLGNPEYDYFSKEWYAVPKQAGTPVLSRPYFDFGGGNIWMVTWSAPFFDQDGKVKGVATADIAFSKIQETITNIQVGENGYAFLLDSEGTILGISENAGGYYEIMTDNMETSTFSQKAKNWDVLVREMENGESGILEATDPQGKSVLVAYTPVELKTGWSLALVFPQNEILEKASSPQNTLILYSVITVLVFAVLLYLLTRYITQPILRLTQYASQLSAEKLHLTEGKLAEPIQLNTGDELEDLAEAFNQMSSELAQSFTTLEDKVADRSRHLERRSLELETIAEVAREITIIHDLKTLLNVSANLIRERFKYYHIGIFLVDERREFAILRAASSMVGQQMLEQNYKLKIEQEGLVGNVIRTGQAVAVDDSAFQNPFVSLIYPYSTITSNGTEANPFLPQTRSEIALPLRTRNIVIGALDIQTDVQSAFGEQDVKVLQLLADQLAAAIENAQLVEKVEGTFAELNNAYRLQTQSVWRSTIKQYKHPSYEYDGVQVRAVPHNLPSDLLMQLENGEPIIVKESDENKDSNAKTTLMVPLMVLNQVIGVIGLEQEDPQHVWSEEEISIAQAAANRAGITLENARLLDESQRRAIKEQTIFAATERIGSALNIGNILHATAEEIERIIGNAEVTLQFNNDNGTSTNEK